MANTCTICKHEQRNEIESAMVQRKPLRDIARQFGASKDAVSRHQTCIAEALEAARTAQAIDSAINVDAELVFCRDTMKKLAVACMEMLADPERPDCLYVGPRADEIDVTYTTDADDEKVRRKAKLSALIERVETRNSITVAWAESKYADPRELLIKASSALGNHMKTYHGFKQAGELEALRRDVEELKAMIGGQK
jgi:hypothetical protein